MRLYQLKYIDLDGLKKFYREKLINEPLTFEYIEVETREGYGVIHAACSSDYIPQKWLSDTWNKLHRAWNVDIRLINGKEEKLANYVLNQYIVNQDAIVNYSLSRSWVYRGFIRDWKAVVKEFGVKLGILEWNHRMEHHIRPDYQTVVLSWQ